MICHRGFINCNRLTSLVQDLDSGRGLGGRERRLGVNGKSLYQDITFHGCAVLVIRFILSAWILSAHSLFTDDIFLLIVL